MRRSCTGVCCIVLVAVVHCCVVFVAGNVVSLVKGGRVEFGTGEGRRVTNGE
jgi:hypothetical protein